MGEAACYAHMLDDQGRMPEPPRIRIQRVDKAIQPDVSEIRILVDRTFPRGVGRQSLGLDGWFKQLAPSPHLKRWFARDPHKWPEFERRYRRELAQNVPELQKLAVLARGGHLVLMHSAGDAEHNHAVVLKELLEDALHEALSMESILSEDSAAAARRGVSSW